ncbi:MAG: rRNA maturation RNase YbeY [Propionibacteriaceae bacterium]|nr:rRNA maturation RNase YbeY [Propionibacteriaceae bacterium]
MIDLNNESGMKVDERKLIQLALFTYKILHIDPEAEMSIQLVDEETMSAYNQKFMGEEGPTDVLSFPMDELRPGSDDELAEGILGDVVLCPAVTRRQAEVAGRSAQEEAEYLLVHGILHLLGFDHGEPEEKRQMFTINDQVIEAWGDQRRGSS